MPAPVLVDYAGMKRGALTMSACGGVPLGQFMLQAGSETPTSWSIVQTGGTAGHWTLATDGTSPQPSTAGDNADLNGGPYTFSVTATGPSGVSNTATLTINIVANTYTVSRPTDVDWSKLETKRGTSTDNGLLGGKTIAVARGATTLLNYVNALRFKGYGTHAVGTRITLTSEDTSNRSKVARVMFDGGTTRWDITGLIFESSRAAATGTSSVQTGNRMLDIFYSNSVTGKTGSPSDIEIWDCTFGAPSTATDPSQWMTAIYITGTSAGGPPSFPTPYFTPADNIRIHDVTMNRVCFPFSISSAANCSVKDVIVDRFCGGAGLSGNRQLRYNTFERITLVRPYLNPANKGDHLDFIQPGGGAPTGDYVGNTFKNIYCIIADGTGQSQGFFFDDVGKYDYGAGNVATGFAWSATTLRNGFYDGSSSHGFTADYGAGWDVDFVTAIRGAGANVILQLAAWTGASQDAQHASPALRTSSGTLTTGTVNRSVFQASSGPVATSFSMADTVILDTAVGVGSFGTTSTNEAARVAYYAQVFNDPGRAIDYPNLTAAQILAEIRLAYSPKLNGPLMIQSDGTYAGAFFPDGTDNDGSVYGAVGPTAIAISANLSSVTQGRPVTLTYQLNAPATADVTITPTATGLAGSFSAATFIIATGASSGQVTFTPSAAGAVQLGCTNNRSLTNPSAISVTSTAPVATPTAFSQSLSSAAVTLGSQVVVTWSLNAPATSAVTITPASTLPGTWSAANVVIAIGQTSAYLTFSPSSPGSGQISATDNAGLTDPSPQNLSCVVARRGSLRRYGIR